MGMRIHTTPVQTLALSLLEEGELVELYGAAFARLGRCLVLEDSDNLEAFVLVGNLGAFEELAQDILRAVRRSTYSGPGGD